MVNEMTSILTILQNVSIRLVDFDNLTNKHAEKMVKYYKKP